MPQMVDVQQSLPVVVLHVIAAILTFVCVLTDFKYRKIYNIITIPGFVFLFLGSIASSAYSFNDVGVTLALCLLIYGILFQLRILGGGDLKLAAMLSTLFDWHRWLEFQMYVLIAFCAVGILVLLKEKKLKSFFTDLKRMGVEAFLRQFHRGAAVSVSFTHKTKAPMAFALFIGFIVSKLNLFIIGWNAIQ